MNKQTAMIREEALKNLKQHGIKGIHIYLIDIIPLIEMIWSDGKAQASEVDILKDYLHKHVDHVNKLADHEVLTFDIAHDFVLYYLKNRPDPELLKTLRLLVAPVRLSSSDTEANNALRESLLVKCLDIASSAVVEYPYDFCGRFNLDEKKCFFEILESL